jgi:uncharacterized membrane protein
MVPSQGTNFCSVSRNFLKALPELIEAGIISEAISESIKTFYDQKKNQSQNRLFVAFGILGGVLVGLGIILIIAHNWDILQRPVKIALAFLPLLVAQALGFFVIFKKAESTAWRESTAAFLFFAVGSSISLISQIYNIPGNLGSFLLTWMLLCLPVIYLLRSSMMSLLIIVGITSYVCEVSYWTYNGKEAYLYWLVIGLIAPYYYLLTNKNPQSNFLVFHDWLLALSLTICLGSLTKEGEEIMYMSYLAMFGLFVFIGNTSRYQDKIIINNPWRVIGSAGFIIVLLMLSFEWYWEDLMSSNEPISEYREFYLYLFLLALSAIFIIQKAAKSSWKFIGFSELVPFVMFPVFLLGQDSVGIPMVIVNLLVFTIGLVTVRKGFLHNLLGLMNYGLLIIAALVVCRFFDTDLSYVIRGILFVTVGIGFFATNYIMLKQRKSHEQ